MQDQRKVLVEAIETIMSKLHEIWQFKGNDILIQTYEDHECCLNLGELLH